MPRTLNEVISALPAHEREIKARAEQLIAEEMSLQDLRKAIGKTQTAIAKRSKVGRTPFQSSRYAATCISRRYGDS